MKKKETPSFDVDPGQVRLHHLPGVKSSDVANSIRKALGSLEGVNSVRINPSSGSVLIRHDSDKMDPDSILDAVSQVEDLKGISWDDREGGAESEETVTVRPGSLSREVSRAVEKALFQIASSLFGPAVAYGLTEGNHVANDEPLPVKVHLTPGRMRLKVPELKRNKPLARKLEESLMDLDQVLSVRARPLTGSLVVKFQPGSLTSAEVVKLLRESGCFRQGVTHLDDEARESLEAREVSNRIISRVVGRAARRAAMEAVSQLFSMARKVVSVKEVTDAGDAENS